MTIPPSKADMKRGGLGPSPARRNLLWESTRARQQAQIAPVSVAAREGKGGAFIRVTGEHGTVAELGRALGAYKTAKNRAACRQGHVMVGRYVAAREAEREIPAPIAVVGDWAVWEDHRAPEPLRQACGMIGDGRPQVRPSAVADILSQSALASERFRLQKALR